MIKNAIREFLWGIIHVVLILSDWVYDMINSFITIDISSNQLIWYVFTFGILFLFCACMLRVFFVLIKKMNNDEEQLDYGIILKRIVQMFIVITLVPTFFTFSLLLPNEINRIFTRSISMGEVMTPSTSVLTSVAKTPLNGELSEMKGNDEIVDIDTVYEDLNKTQDNEYIYFRGYGEIFFCGIMGLLCATVLVNIFTQIVERWFLQIYRLFIGFIPISGMIDPNDTGCSQWIRDIISDVLAQSWTLISLWCVLAIMGLDEITSMNGIIRLFMFIIGVASVSKIGDIIAKYLGATNLSKGNRIGSAIATAGLYGLARSSKNLVKKTISFAGNTALTTGAGAVYGMGRSMGGKSMSDMGMKGFSKLQTPSDKSTNFNDKNSFSDNPLNTNPVSDMKKNNQSFHGINIEKNNGKEEFNPLNDNVNYKQSSTSKSNQSRNENVGLKDSNYSYEKNPQKTQGTNYTENINSSDYKGVDQGNSLEKNDDKRLTRSNTLARSFVDSANNMKGIKGMGARAISNAGSHLYVASAKRYSSSALRKANTILSTPKQNPYRTKNNYKNTTKSYKNTTKPINKSASKKSLSKSSNKKSSNEFVNLNQINNNPTDNKI